MRLRTTAFAAMMLALLPVAGSPGDGLGDVASRESQKRQRKPAARVFTDDDLHRRGDGAAAAGAAAPGNAPLPPAAAASSASEAAPDPLEREREERRQLEARWRQRFADARTRLAVAETASWRDVIRTEFYNGIPVQMRVQEQVETEDLQQARRALADLQEEFRRTGLPAGWARESGAN